MMGARVGHASSTRRGKERVVSDPTDLIIIGLITGYGALIAVLAGRSREQFPIGLRRWMVLTLGAALLHALSLLLPAWLLLGTRYSLTDDALKVRAGPFRWTVPLAEISSVRPSRSILSAPALSLDRIQIDYGARRILISPRERQRFVDELRQRCPKARITGF